MYSYFVDSGARRESIPLFRTSGGCPSTPGLCTRPNTLTKLNVNFDGVLKS